MKAKTRTANDAYNEHLDALRTKIDRLQKLYLDLTGDGAPVEVNWGNVGDVEHLHQSLDEALDFQFPNPRQKASKRKAVK